MPSAIKFWQDFAILWSSATFFMQWGGGGTLCTCGDRPVLSSGLKVQAAACVSDPREQNMALAQAGCD